MTRTTRMLGIALIASTALATTAYAQRDYSNAGQQMQQQQPPPQAKGEKETKQQKGGATVTIGNRKVALSPEFAKAYNDLLASVNANDAAAVAAKAPAAHAAAKIPEEHYLASQLELKAGMAAKNDTQIAAGLQGMLDSGIVPQEQLPVLYNALGKTRYNLKQFPQAAAAFEKQLAIQPNDSEAMTLLATSKANSGQSGDAVAILQKEIAQQSANGGKAPEELYKRAIQSAYKAKLPAVVELSRDWVVHYPSASNWSDAIRIYRNMNTIDDATTLDLLRLARAAGALKGEEDYDRYAYAAITKGYPGEAKTVLEEGIKAGTVNPAKTPFKEMISEAQKKSAGEEATLASATKSALGGATAKPALATGDLLYGYGQYDKAAELYRAALKKSGADASLINLHLGMALARSGDKAGATAAFNAVTGPRAEVAKYWLAYLSTQA